MLTRALVAERGDAHVPLINELLVDAPIKTCGSHHGPVQADEIAAEEVAAVVRAWLRNGSTANWPRMRFRGPLIIMQPRCANVVA